MSLMPYDWKDPYVKAFNEWRKQVQFAHDSDVSRDVHCALAMQWQALYEMLVAEAQVRWTKENHETKNR